VCPTEASAGKVGVLKMRIPQNHLAEIRVPHDAAATRFAKRPATRYYERFGTWGESA